MTARDKKLSDIINWAENNPDIRAALLTSSLVNPLAPVDEFSDLDVELIFENNAAYVTDAEWIRTFGEPIAIMAEGEESFAQKHAMKMVLYEDRVKVDFKLFSKAKFLVEAQQDALPEDWDIGYKVLLDKEGLTRDMKEPSFRVSIIAQPTEEKFRKLVLDFWWDTSYVAKCLARDNIFYAKFMSENIIRTDYLVPLIEWHIASEHDWNITTNKHGRLFKKYLDPETWAKLEQTFSGSDLEGNWTALFKMADLVNEMGSGLAEKLGYTYPSELERKLRKYLTDTRS